MYVRADVRNLPLFYDILLVLSLKVTLISWNYQKKNVKSL